MSEALDISPDLNRFLYYREAFCWDCNTSDHREEPPDQEYHRIFLTKRFAM